MVSLAAEAGSTGIKTFSVAYREGAAFDESSYARRVSKHFATDHEVLYVEPAQFQGFIPDYVWHMDEPVTEAAALSLYFISKQLRQKVTVALSGEGADELFAGYRVYQYMQWLERYRSLPRSLRDGVLSPVLRRLPHPRARRFAMLAEAPLDQRYLGVPLYDARRQDGLYSPRFARSRPHQSSSPLTQYWAASEGWDPLSRMLYVDQKAWLVDDLLVKADKMTMASSVELRVPFLDHRVVEFAATVPSSMKLRQGQVKWILKRAMDSRLPTEILGREKVGFPTPLASMFRGSLSEYLYDVLLSRRAVERGYFVSAAVERLVVDHTEGRADHHKTLWQLVVLEEWHRRFIDRGSAAIAASPGVLDALPIQTARM